MLHLSLAASRPAIENPKTEVTKLQNYRSCKVTEVTKLQELQSYRSYKVIEVTTLQKLRGRISGEAVPQ